MKRILFLPFAVGLTANMTIMAGMSTSKVCKEMRFPTDKMAYELNSSTQQYNDAYEINYDFIHSVRNIMDYVVRGYEWALDDYYEALDIRNDDLRWVLGNAWYRRFLGAGYLYRPIYITGRKWSFGVYVNYPNRSLLCLGVPYHYRTYCGAHCRPHFHHVSYHRGRYANFSHYPAPHRVRDQRVFHFYRRSDLGSVQFRPNASICPHNVPIRPGNSSRPGSSTTRPGTSCPGTSTCPDTSTRPGTATRPGTPTRPRPKFGGDRPSTSVRPSTLPGSRRPGNSIAPDKNGNTNRVEGDRNPGRRPETGSGSSDSNRRPTSGSSTGSSSSNRESGGTSSSSRESSSKRNDSGSYSRNNSSGRNNNPSGSSRGSSNRSSSSRSDSGRNGGSAISRSDSTTSNRSSGSSDSTRSNVSSEQTERRSSSGSMRSNSTQSSSCSSERNNSSPKR